MLRGIVLIICVLAGIIFSYGCCYCLIKVSQWNGIVSQVRKDRFGSDSKPLLGGIAIFLTFWIGVGIFLFFRAAL